MDIEQPAAEVAEQEAAPVEPVEETAIETDGEEGEETDALDDLLQQATGAEANPEDAEIDYEGEKFKVPAKLKDAFLRQSDYTKKTMDLAEQRKSVEETKTKVEEIFTASREAIQSHFAAEQAEARVEQLLKTPIEGLDGDQINALRLDLADARAAVTHYQGEAAKQASKAATERSQHLAKAVDEARKEASKHIPNFDDAKIAALGSLVKDLGGDPEAVKQLADPTAFRVLHLAHIGQQFIERQRQAGKAAHSVPAAEVTGGKAAPTKKDLVKDADKMTSDEWLKARNADLAKQAKR